MEASKGMPYRRSGGAAQLQAIVNSSVGAYEKDALIKKKIKVSS
jgi:hypothetical protein